MNYRKFIISPVRNIDDETAKKIKEYVELLEKQNHKVHWPARDTPQNDPTGGYQICKTNFEAIMKTRTIHIWYDETSHGSKFDMGGVFMLIEMLGWKKKIIIANENEVIDDTKKSFFKVFKKII